MIKIIALTNVGGMVVGKEYEVGNQTASILTKAKYCKYASDSDCGSEAYSLVEDTTNTLAEDQVKEHQEDVVETIVEVLDKDDQDVFEVLETVKKKRRR